MVPVSGSMCKSDTICIRPNWSSERRSRTFQHWRSRKGGGLCLGKFGKELIESMQQAARHAAGKKVRGLRVSKVELPDVKAIRLSLRMSQHHFAAAYRIPLPTLKNWEQGRRMPDAPAAAYLLAIKRRPKEVMEAVARP